MLLIQHADSYYLKYEEIESTMSKPSRCLNHITTFRTLIKIYTCIRIIISIAGLEHSITREMQI